jgi:hypothetical protein
MISKYREIFKSPCSFFLIDLCYKSKYLPGLVCWVCEDGWMNVPELGRYRQNMRFRLPYIPCRLGIEP